MISENQKELYALALTVFGPENQLAVLQEECGELVAAVNHYRRDKIGVDPLLDELAGVHIMVSQAILIFGEEPYKKALARQLTKLMQHIKRRLQVHEAQTPPPQGVEDSSAPTTDSTSPSGEEGR